MTKFMYCTLLATACALIGCSEDKEAAAVHKDKLEITSACNDKVLEKFGSGSVGATNVTIETNGTAYARATIYDVTTLGPPKAFDFTCTAKKQVTQDGTWWLAEKISIY